MFNLKTILTGVRIRIALTSLFMLVLISASPLQASADRYGTTSYNQTQYSDSQLRSKLLRHFYRWEGAPYRFGGNSRYGVDCSGFVHVAFRDALGMDVPRSTKLLSTAGPRISSSRLKTGDIIIFRTSRSNLHTGIYVGKNQFIHASKSKGVILSKLSNPYWKDVYYKSVRVL
jgi:probable lipoprotein NlpC